MRSRRISHCHFYRQYRDIELSDFSTYYFWYIFLSTICKSPRCIEAVTIYLQARVYRSYTIFDKKVETRNEISIFGRIKKGTYYPLSSSVIEGIFPCFAGHNCI